MTDADHGRELWISDGTTAGTFMLKDLAPGETSSTPKDLAAVGSLLFFSAEDPDHGREVWRSDGTPDGTFLVQDLSPGAAPGVGLDELGVAPEFTDLSGTAIFAGSNGVAGRELFASDGSPGSAQLLEARSGPTSSISQGRLTRLGGLVLFNVVIGDDWEMWRTDGTQAGTWMVKDFGPPGAQGFESPLADPPFMYFAAGPQGTLWRTDGTAEGTVELGGGINVAYISLVGGTLFYQAEDPTTGIELWMSDRLSAGELAADIAVGTVGTPSNDSYPETVLDVGAVALVAADAKDGTGREPWWVAIPWTSDPPPFTAFGGGLASGDLVEAWLGSVSCGTTEADATGDWLLLINFRDPCHPLPGQELTFSLNGLPTAASETWAAGGIPDDEVEGVTLVPLGAVVVNTTDDIDDGLCDSLHCSLREAILVANATPGTEITFDPAVFVAGPVRTYVVLTGLLPVVTGDGTRIVGSASVGIRGGDIPTNSVPDGGLLINANDVHVEGLLITDFYDYPGPGIPPGVGVGIFNSSNVTVQDVITNAPRAFELTNDTDTLLLNVRGTGFSDEGFEGVASFGSTGLEIRDSTFRGFNPTSGSAPGRGIVLSNPTDVVIVGNQIGPENSSGANEQGIAVLGNGTPQAAGNVRIDGNTINDGAVYGVLVSNTSGVAITRNTITDNALAGIATLNSSNVTIGDASDPSMANTILRNEFGGIHILDGSSGVSVVGGNVIQENRVLGIWVDESSSLGSIGGTAPGEGNSIRNNVGLGIWLQRRSEASIRGNDFGNNVFPDQPSASGDILLDPGTNGDVASPLCSATIDSGQLRVDCSGEPGASLDVHHVTTGSDGNELIDYVGTMAADGAGGSSDLFSLPVGDAIRVTQTTTAGHTSNFTDDVIAPPLPAAPVVESVAPATGSLPVGNTQLFQVVYSDVNGAGDISWTGLWLTPDGDLVNDCFAIWAGGQFFLFDDTASTLLPANGGTVANTQCELDGAASSVSVNGSQLQVTFAISPLGGSIGEQFVVPYVSDSSGFTGISVEGPITVFVQSTAPRVIDAHPTTGAVGTDFEISFTATFTDVDGASDIAWAAIWLTPDGVLSNDCFVLWNGGQLLLFNDAGSDFLVAGAVGSGGTVSNGQCTLNAGRSIQVLDGNELTISVVVTFDESFTGNHFVVPFVTDSLGQQDIQVFGPIRVD